MDNKLLYLKITPSIFRENSRDERELEAAFKAGWKNICVVAPKGQKSLYDFSGERRYEEIDLRPLGEGKIAKQIGKIIAFYRYIKIIRKLKPTVISGHDLLGILIAYISTIGLRKKPRLIYDAHEYEMARFTNNHRSYLKSKAIFFSERYLIKKSVLTITVNQSIYNQMKVDYNLDFPAVVIRNIPILKNADKNKSIQIRKEWQFQMELNPNDKIYIYHGMVAPERGIEEAIQTVSSTECGGLVIMGHCNDDNYKIKLRTIISDSKNPRRIMIHEAVSGAELFTYLAAADIGVVLIKPITKSYFFALPNKLFESIHAGNPVIASNLPEITQIVQSYGIGIICDPENSNDIEGKWIEMYNQKIDKVYKENIDNACKYLNWQAESKKLINELKELL